MLPSHRLASGAEEKIVRVFESTKNFLQNLSNLSKLNVDSECSSKVRFLSDSEMILIYIKDFAHHYSRPNVAHECNFSSYTV